MSFNVNNGTWGGRATAAPKVKTVGRGNNARLVADFNIEVDQKRTDRNGKPIPDFFHVEAWFKTAQYVQQHVYKGCSVIATGSIHPHAFNDRRGGQHFEVVISANDVHACGITQQSQQPMMNQMGQQMPSAPMNPYPQQQPRYPQYPQGMMPNNQTQQNPNPMMTNNGNNGMPYDPFWQNRVSQQPPQNMPPRQPNGSQQQPNGNRQPMNPRGNQPTDYPNNQGLGNQGNPQPTGNRKKPSDDLPF